MTYTAGQLTDIRMIQDFVATHNRLPQYNENRTTPTFPNGAHFRKTFGNMSDAIRAAGYTPLTAVNSLTLTCVQCEQQFTLTGRVLSSYTAYSKERGVDRPPFCSRSCATRYTNKIRGKRSDKTKAKIKASVIASRPPKTPPLEYCKVFLVSCAHCDRMYVSRMRVKYCQDHQHLYKNRNRNKYAFSFSLSDHPSLFRDRADLLKLHGMWSYTNPMGLTRDHRVSVNDAIRHNYDPYYIKHPLNCELMSWTENNSKKSKSSITYATLKEQVDAYDRNAVQVGIEPT